jgi:outer membrane protein OmpA-like peptidoglycan-associated protein
MKRILFCLLLIPTLLNAETFKEMVGNVQVGEVKKTEPITLPLITWGADYATILANGGTGTTQPNSIFAQRATVKYKLKLNDDPVQQVKDYMTGETPYLRMTARMAGLPLEVLSLDPRTKPVPIYQLSFSAGDHLVFKEAADNLEKKSLAGGGFKYLARQPSTLNDLKGKRVAIQRGGPHLGLLDDSLKAAGMTWDDIKIVWCKDLTASDDSPAALMRAGKADAACVITPDMIGLCSDMKGVGTGAEGTVKGARVMNSTATMSRSIADLYLVRSDYFTAEKGKVMALVECLLMGAEEVVKLRNDFEGGATNSPKYLKLLKQAQSFFGEEVLPSIEVDAHGLVLDCKFSRIPGNESFFTDPSNLANFDAKTKSAVDLSIQLGYAANRHAFGEANWGNTNQYKDWSIKIGVPYVEPKFSKNRINAEAIKFSEIDDEPILSFEINFGVGQTKFDPAKYGAQFQRVAESAHLFGNAAIIVRGHADNYLVLKEFYFSAKGKGLITGASGSRLFKGKRLDLADTQTILNALRNENLSGSYKYPDGSRVGDPKQTANTALQLSRQRAVAVKQGITTFLKDKGIDESVLEQIQPFGVGISEPAVPRPRSGADMAKNRRVEFMVVPLNPEAIASDEDFDFDE